MQKEKYKNVKDNSWFYFHTQTPVPARGHCAYLDNTGQTGWFNYPCNKPGYRYKNNVICKMEGIPIQELFDL